MVHAERLRLVPVALALAGTLMLAGCSGGSSTVPDRSVVPTASPVPVASGPSLSLGVGSREPPPPDAPIPRDPQRLAGVLAATNGVLERSIDGWLRDGDPSVGRPPADVVLLSLYQQRIYRLLAGNDRLLGATITALPPGLRGQARANATAGARLFSLIGPPSNKPPQLETTSPEPAGVLLGFFREAERRFGVDWEVLAAINLVESKFGRVVSASSAGAQGPMQFIPSTWQAYGLGGDVHDPHDAILGAANYLRASGAPGAYRSALFHYNPANAYVDAVLRYARQMMHDPRRYFAYYNWQVFVFTRNGDQRITGPGL